jgi:hypothetical protein
LDLLQRGLNTDLPCQPVHLFVLGDPDRDRRESEEEQRQNGAVRDTIDHFEHIASRTAPKIEDDFFVNKTNAFLPWNDVDPLRCE